MNEVMFDSNSDPAESGENQEERVLPPLASNGDINLWLDEDKNGNVFVRIDAPFLESEPVFFNDDVKPGLNQLVEKWREQRK